MDRLELTSDEFYHRRWAGTTGPEALMVRAGRRPGKADTRAEIAAAAGAAFAELGYEKASIRGIAKRAGVDPALVHHYFADKSALFTEAMALPRDPSEVRAEVTDDGLAFSGQRLVERFLAQWETGPGPGEGSPAVGSPAVGSPAFVTMAQAVAASPRTADALRESLSDRIGLPGGTGGDEEDEETRGRRRALICTQLLGLGWVRYVMRLEPIASAERGEVARWVGPTIDRYAGGELPGLQ